jgi:hypothetical protein
MKVLVATNRTQGAEPGDYCWTVEGELVLGGPILECCRADQCGCGRGFPGLASAKATTTATILDRLELNRELLGLAIQESLRRQGWLGALGPDEVEQGVEDEIQLIELIAGSFDVGTVLGRHGTQVFARRAAAA